jgi:hypothetical protein
VSCVNYFCTPSSTVIATQIFESYCAGGVLPTGVALAAATTSSGLAVSPSSASQTIGMCLLLRSILFVAY